MDKEVVSHLRAVLEEIEYALDVAVPKRDRIRVTNEKNLAAKKELRKVARVLDETADKINDLITGNARYDRRVADTKRGLSNEDDRDHRSTTA